MSFTSSIRVAFHQRLTSRDVLFPIKYERFYSYWTAKPLRIGLSPFKSIPITTFSSISGSNSTASNQLRAKRHVWKAKEPGDLAFAAGEVAAVSDLFFRYANTSDGGIDDEGCSFLTPSGVRKMLASIGENPDDETFDKLFRTADLNGDGKLQLQVRFENGFRLTI